jgi:hypothetical protein
MEINKDFFILINNSNFIKFNLRKIKNIFKKSHTSFDFTQYLKNNPMNY